MEDIKIEQIQIGQDRKYGDFYYKYKIYTKCEDLENVLKEIKDILKKEYDVIMPIITGRQWENEDNCADNHFRNYYNIQKQEYGYYLVITSPSTH